MAVYSVAEAKNTLPVLINRAMAGEDVVITRHGKPVAELRRPAPRTRADIAKADARLFAGRVSRPEVSIGSVELLELMHEEEARDRLLGR